MARIKPVAGDEILPAVKKAFEEHASRYSARITNMKATLGHSLPAFDVYMQWYPLYEEVKKITGKRSAYLFAWAISNASNCPLCSMYFRKIMIDEGEDPANLRLSDHEEALLNFGGAIAQQQGNINDLVYNAVSKQYNEQEMVVLIAFAGQMIATNIFNNVIETEIDGYLEAYLPKSNK